MKKQSAAFIWDEYQKAMSYNRRLDLFEQVKKSENFYIGKQWEGLNAPDLNKPVINVLKRVVSYFISMLVSDDVAASFTPFRKTLDSEQQAKILSEQIDQVIELADLKAKSREVVRNAAVDGDGCLYFYFDPDAETGQAARGRISTEVLDNTAVMFGNPYSSDLQNQPYIIISMRKTLESVRREVGNNIEIVPDVEEGRYDPTNSSGDELVTVLIKFWKQDGTIWAVKSTRDVILREPWNLKYTRYPIAFMQWEKVKNSYHGVSALSGMIPNQISINQLFAMAIHSVKSMAFPKIIYDASKIPNWSNKVGQAIGTIGNPNDAIATGFRAPDMSAQVMELIDRLIQKTLEFMGASDTALGNIRPDNTSAIIATQKASAMPLEIQRLEFYRFTEDYVRIIIDMMRVDYGIREVCMEVEGKMQMAGYDFANISDANLNMMVDIGSSAYWSELMQVQTLDNLFAKGIITDAVTYLEGVPDRYIRGKGKILEKLRERQAAEETAASTAQMPQNQMMGEMPQVDNMAQMPEVNNMAQMPLNMGDIPAVPQAMQ